jgi:hypothetical protein
MLPRPPGKLITWTKGFTCEGVVGKDPVQLLEQALKRAGRPCRVGDLRGHAAMLLCGILMWSLTGNADVCDGDVDAVDAAVRCRCCITAWCAEQLPVLSWQCLLPAATGVGAAERHCGRDGCGALLRPCDRDRHDHRHRHQCLLRGEGEGRCTATCTATHVYYCCMYCTVYCHTHCAVEKAGTGKQGVGCCSCWVQRTPTLP